MSDLNIGKAPADVSPDGDDRIHDFLNRHGGAGTAPVRKESHAGGTSGWSEVYAADGHILRCEWSRFGDREEMQFTELSPESRSTAGGERPAP